jgi:aminoglycoside phosphotransferase family enzyme
VILAGDYVYKFKKPVNFGFLDFSDLEKRRICCEQEVLLNRRLCPTIYLGMVRVTAEPDGGFALDGAGPVVEYGVKMRRMPEERMMGRLIRSGGLEVGHIDALVAVLADFYQGAESGSEIVRFGTAAAVAVNVLENFDQTHGFIGQGALNQAQFDAVAGYARAVLADAALFQRRIDGGHIRDCHGDLYSANICLADQVYIYDCIEFNQRFRYCDVASDVAFLLMDLELHGLESLAARFVDRFVQATKDEGIVEMLNFYKCYRAYVRGKIGLFTAADPAVDPAVRTANTEQAAKYFQLAQRYAVF